VVRDELLSLLTGESGKWLTAEDVSRLTGIPVASIRGHILTLQAEGHQIETSPDKGFRFVPDSLSVDAVSPGLNTSVFGKVGYVYYDETDSTNIRAQALACSGYPEGTVVVAERQTSGRGRRGRSWYSPAGQGIYMTIILRPDLPWQHISRVSLLAAVAVAETLEEELGLPAGIKWPNDVLINGRKICGILSEAAVSMEGIQYIVTGIGININNPPREFPEDFRTDPTSVLAEKKQSVSRVRILQVLLARLESYYYQALEGRFAEILEKGRRLSLVIGQEVGYDAGKGQATGLAIDLDENGSLLVRDPGGVVHTVISGEVSVMSAEEKD